MKIPLKMGADSHQSARSIQNKNVEKEILGAKNGNWDAKNALVRTFTPLLTQLAQKRSKNIGDINRLMDLGKEGLFKAAKKYSPSMGTEKFQVLAMDMIEQRMDGKVGFFARLFGG